MKIEIYHADTCLPDYWSGHHMPHVSIPVYPGMTMKDIKSAIRSEVAQGALGGSTDDVRLLTGSFVPPEDEKRADRLTRATYAGINRMKPAKKGQRRFFTDIEAPGNEYDECESCYAYFILEVQE